jgi:putative AlgH/UPF0301 family transcriptional regulator
MNTEQRNADQNSSTQHLLVTSPHVRGTPYDRRVIFLVEHNTRRSVGLVVDEAFRKSMRRLRDGSFLPDQLNQRSPAGVALPVDVVVWGPGQLKAEADRGIWLSAQVDLHELLEPHDDLWVDMVRSVGRAVLRDACGIQDFATDPTVN